MACDVSYVGDDDPSLCAGDGFSQFVDRQRHRPSHAGGRSTDHSTAFLENHGLLAPDKHVRRQPYPHAAEILAIHRLHRDLLGLST